MYYLAHLALPAIAALILAASGAQIELSISWLARMTEKLTELYLILSAPHWVWAAISSYFEASKSATVGGFVGLHLLLFLVWLLVAQSNESHAANGWFIYFLGAPIVIAIGAVAGRYVASWKTRQSA
ncbi:hypothetical protein [Pseudothauera hydrothermalis]|uniref:hypothetical protein n=1 Tax=Pseudothauera hydrothermalis TaxID=2184083 RepID=UPI000E093103|nr:hypothetical protein [Pseudothauera hydrothermalis]